MENTKLITDAAHRGDIETLNKLLQENPSLLHDIAFSSPPDSVLHVATKAGQVGFVVELMKHNRNLARELNKNGFRPLDIAAMMGNVEMVKELLRLDPGICLLNGKGRNTALHYASTKGKVEVIDELVSTCPDCLKDVTFRQETALHLALKSFQFDAFEVLVKWLEIHKLQSIINWPDQNGDTVLHLAAAKKQHESIQSLFSKSDICATINVNAKNFRGLRAADILDTVMENPDDFRSREILMHGAAYDPSANFHYQANDQQSGAGYQSSQHLKNWLKYFKFQMQRDSPSDARNALLVVAALIAAVTFQAGVNPPSGVLEPNSQNQAGAPPPPAGGPVPGPVLAMVASAIFGSHASSYLFFFSNSLGLTASLSIIIYLTGGFPFQRELIISICAMMSTYFFSIISILRREKKEKEVVGYFLVSLAFLLPFLLRWLPPWGEMAWKKCRRQFSQGRNLLPP